MKRRRIVIEINLDFSDMSDAEGDQLQDQLTEALLDYLKLVGLPLGAVEILEDR
jgi:hypothetical protein